MADDDRLLQTNEAIGASVLQIDRSPEIAFRVFNLPAPLQHV